MAKALELDDSMAELHVLHGNQKAVQWDWLGAERETGGPSKRIRSGRRPFFLRQSVVDGAERPEEWEREIERGLGARSVQRVPTKLLRLAAQLPAALR